MRPGQDITLEYGVSQYLSKRFEIGSSGYSEFQVSDDSGSAASQKTVHSKLNGVGGEINYWLIPGKLLSAQSYTYEYNAVGRFREHNGEINFIYKWGNPIIG